MFQKFFENTIETQFIKNLISNFPIPNFPSINNTDYIIHTMKYIYGDKIIECLSSGYIEPKDNNQAQASYRIIQPYIFGKEYVNFTHTYQSKDKYYSAEDHYNLGELLRYYRDIQYIDLMPFYNCFNYKVITGNLIKESGNNYCYSKSEQTTNNGKLFAIPIKWNKTYTISMDIDKKVIMLPILFNEFGELKDSKLNPYFKTKSVQYEYLQFLNPITFKVSPSDNTSSSVYNYEELMAHYEKYLYLLIQLPENANTSIVILEGDYTQNKSQILLGEPIPENNKFASDEEEEEPLKYKEIIYSRDIKDNIQLNKTLIRNPSLLLVNDGNIYAYSNRLIEHLLFNPIGHYTNRWQDIARVQKMANMTKYAGYQANVWTNKMRIDLYEKYLNPTYKEYGGLKLDVNGFVNHNVERMLLRGASNK